MANHITLNFKTEVFYDKWVDSVEARMIAFLDKAGNDILLLAQSEIPVDTTGARESGYTLSETHDGSMQAEAAAKSVKPKIEFALNDLQPKYMTVFVVFAAIYGMALEYGTSQNANPMAANNGHRPFLTPAVHNYEDQFFAGCKAVLSAG
jgi:hypothetical protein